MKKKLLQIAFIHSFQVTPSEFELAVFFLWRSFSSTFLAGKDLNHAPRSELSKNDFKKQDKKERFLTLFKAASLQGRGEKETRLDNSVKIILGKQVSIKVSMHSTKMSLDKILLK